MTTSARETKKYSLRRDPHGNIDALMLGGQVELRLWPSLGQETKARGIAEKLNEYEGMKCLKK